MGVKLSKDIIVNNWMLQPILNLNIAFNTIDNNLQYTTIFTGLEDSKLHLESQILDKVNYGVTLGLKAQSGNFGLCVGISYLASENTNAFNVQANAPYRF